MRSYSIEPLEARIAPATITIAAANVLEGDSTAGTPHQFEVKLDAASTTAITVDFVLEDGAAVAGTHYTVTGGTTSGTLTFNPGQTSAFISFDTVGDETQNPDRDFTVKLSNASSGTTFKNNITSGKVTILDDDAVVGFSGVTSQTVTEGNTGTKAVSFTVSIPQAAGHAITVPFSLVDGTATLANNDFQVPTVASVTIPAGATSANFSVNVVGDTVAGPDESFQVKLAAPQNGQAKLTPTAGDQVRSVTIQNDDAGTAPVPLITIGNATGYEGGNAVFTVSLSTASESAVTVNYATAPGSATSGTDYTATNGVLTIGGGLTKTISVPLAGDALVEGSEQFTLALSGPSNGAFLNAQTSISGTGTIQDAVVGVKVRDVQVVEGNEGTSTAIFTLVLDNTTGKAVTLGYSTADGSATASSDYTGVVSGTVTFAANQKTGTIAIPIIGDRLLEAAETFLLNINSASLVEASTGSGTTLAGFKTDSDLQGVGTITNDEGSNVTVSVAPEQSIILEGDPVGGVNTGTANFTVNLSAAYPSDVKVFYSVNGVDVAEPITIPAFSQSATLPVSFNRDDVVTTDQTLIVTLKSVAPVTNNVDGSTFSLPAATKTAKTVVWEDDAFLQVVSLAPGGKSEGNSGTTQMPFQVKVVNAQGVEVKLQHPVTVDLATVDGTATSSGAGQDYQARSGVVRLEANESSFNVNIPVRGDTVAGVDETFSLQISNPLGAGLLPNGTSALATILDDDRGTAPLPQVSYTTAPAAEGSPAVFTFTLDKAWDSPVIFNYEATVATTGANRASVDDFTPVASTQFVIPGGTTSRSISIQTTQDALNEGAETFNFTLSNLTGATLNPSNTLATVGTIAASDQPTLSIANVTVVEGNAPDTKVVTFNVQLSAAATVDVTFDAATYDITALGGSDYVSKNTPAVKIAAGQLSTQVEVTVNGDDLSELDETFGLRLTNIQGAISGKPISNDNLTSYEAIATIQNDESLVAITSSQPDGRVGEAAGTASYTVTRTGADLSAPVTVTYKTVEGTATGADYTATAAGTVIIPAGSASATFTVPITEDTRFEGDQSFSVQLVSAANAALDPAAANQTVTTTITDNDQVPLITVTSPELILETDSGTQTANFVVKLDRANDASEVKIRYSTVNGSAKAGADFVGVTDQTLVFAKGETSKSIPITVLNDLTFDSARQEGFQVVVSLDTPTGSTPAAQFASGSSASALGTIQDNDAAPVVSISAGNITEGGVSNLVARLSNPSDEPVSVKYYTVDSTAKSTGAAADFTGVSRANALTLTFGSLQQTATIPIQTNAADDLVEGDETFKIQLLSPTNATLSKTASSATATILDDDAAYLSVNDITIVEGDNGTKDAVFTVGLIGTTVRPVSVDYATVSGSGLGGATAGSDFLAVNGTLTLGGLNGAQSAQIVVKVVGDLAKEGVVPAGGTAGQETFTVKLSNATVATISRDTGTGTIIDSGDTLPTLSINSPSVVEGASTFISPTGKMTFTATLASAATQDVTFKVSTAELARLANSARAGSDFVALKDQLITIPAGSTSKTFDVTIVRDEVFETREFFNVVVSDVQNAAVTTPVVTGTIQDDDIYRTARVAKWTDKDGDLVTMTTNKASLLYNVLGFAATNGSATIDPTTGGRILSTVDLMQAGQAFLRANISITATQQVDATGALTGDGRVNVGYVRANTLDTAPTPFEVQGIDLGTLTIDGDLSRISVGDTFNDRGIQALNIYSLSVKSAATDPLQPAVGQRLTYGSTILSGAGSIKVTTDVAGSLSATGLKFGSIGRLTVGGSLLGGAEDSSGLAPGRINVTGTLSQATVGNLVGGAGESSGSIAGLVDTSIIGSVKVLGSITGGTGARSGSIIAPRIGSVDIGGSLHGTSTGSGGVIYASGSLGTVKVGENLDQNAFIIGGGRTNKVAIQSVTVGGNVNGASILAGFSYGSVTTTQSGGVPLNADAQISSVQIEGSVARLDILAGTNPEDPTAFASGVFNDGALFSRIARVVINGPIQANGANDPHYIAAQSIGTILVQGINRAASVDGVELAPNTNFQAILSS